jgi:formylglycine-generating enzyme required for sulfatase activity
VTQGQFEAVMGTQPSYFRADGHDRPVEQIRYTDVADYTAQSPNSFLGKLNELLRKNGYGLWEAGLPTEDEWEYACRAGAYTPFNNNTELSMPMNVADIERVSVYGKSETARVASRAPNAWGLYDMHGNVAEWTQNGTLRGGSFRDSAAETRAAARLFGMDSNSTPDRRFGFRVIIRHRDLR